MQLWRHVTRRRWVKVAVGVAAAEYLRFVGSTSSSVTLEPADIYERSEGDMPIIVAFWHGQHFLAPVARKTQHRVKVLVSRHHDGEMNAIAAERLGVGAIRGSGNHKSGFVHKAGVAAFQAMRDALAEGFSVALSADVPKVSRVAGLGVIKLAQASVRSIPAPSPPAAASCSTTGIARRSICRSVALPASPLSRSTFPPTPTRRRWKRTASC